MALTPEGRGRRVCPNDLASPGRRHAPGALKKRDLLSEARRPSSIHGKGTYYTRKREPSEPRLVAAAVAIAAVIRRWLVPVAFKLTIVVGSTCSLV